MDLNIGHRREYVSHKEPTCSGVHGIIKAPAKGSYHFSATLSQSLSLYVNVPSIVESNVKAAPEGGVAKVVQEVLRVGYSFSRAHDYFIRSHQNQMTTVLSPSAI